MEPEMYSDAVIILEATLYRNSIQHVGNGWLGT